MKIIIGIGILIVLGIAGFMLGSKEVGAPAETNTPATTEELEEANQDRVQEEDTSASVSEMVDVEVEAEAEASASAETEAGPQTFTLDSFNYGYSEEVIRVPAGTEVTINLTNSGGFHDWVLDEFGAATAKISAGDTTSVTFVAGTPGTYEYYCSVGNHRDQGMVGTLIVE